jgi:hypothetical protein
MTGRFVWLRGLRGPEPQRWTDPTVGPDFEDRILAAVPISGEDLSVPLDDLIRRFPAPAIEVLS